MKGCKKRTQNPLWHVIAITYSRLQEPYICKLYLFKKSLLSALQMEGASISSNTAQIVFIMDWRLT